MSKILIVDDEADTCEMLSQGLQLLGFETDYALSGAQALAKLRANLPDAIVLDLMMPDTDGFEVTRYLRARPDTASTPIIIVTATAQLDAETQSMQAEATVFLHKPIGMRVLGDTIQRTLQ